MQAQYSEPEHYQAAAREFGAAVRIKAMTEPSAITVRFMNELEDHIAAYRLYYKESIWDKADKVVAAMLFGWGLLLVWCVGFYWWAVIWFPLAVVEWFGVCSPTRWRIKKMYLEEPKFREEYQLTFSREHILFKTASIDSILQWTYYESFSESPELFLLHYGKGLYTVIPKRGFRLAEDMDAFRTLIVEILG